MTDSPSRGEVWLVAFDPTVGAEIQKTRPALVMSSGRFDRLPLRLVVPLTTWQRRFEFHYNKVRIVAIAGSGLTHDSAADVMQTRSVSVARFVRRVGKLSADDVSQVAANLAIAIEHS